MKKMMKMIGKVTAVCALFLLAGVYFAFSHSITKQREEQMLCHRLHIQVADSMNIQLVKEQDVLQYLKDQKVSLVGEKICEIDLYQLKQLINQEKGVKNCEVYTAPEDGLNIRIWQLSPLWRLETARGSYYMGDDGKLFPTIPKRAVYVPVVSGEIPINDSVWMAALFDFGIYIRSHQFWNTQIEQIYVHQPHNIEIIQRADTYTTVMMGDLSRFEYKLQKLYSFYLSVAALEGWDKYSYLDIRYGDQIVCRRTPTNNKSETKK
ncbi:MAG: hypothetical protein LBC84_04325 [Prevotellaceae bacterium]|jgi:cell division protein FtsQ|nr:hypothetical protein [Prevotellaceae bacterium]